MAERAPFLLLATADRQQQTLAAACAGLGYRVATVTEAGAVLPAVAGADCLLVDLDLAGGRDLVAQVVRRYPSVVVAAAASDPSLETVLAVLRAGAGDFFVKPVDAALLDRFLAEAMARRFLEQELLASRDEYRLVAETAMDAVVVLTGNGRVAYWNPAAADIFGVDATAAYGRDLDVVLGRPGLLARLRERGSRGVELTLDAGRVVELRYGAMAGHGRGRGVCLGRDISERKAQEEALRASRAELARRHHELQVAQTRLVQHEKLAAIGELAAGIAHEINNPMGYVYANLQTLERYLAVLLRAVEDHGAVEETKLARVRDDVGPLVDETLEGARRVKRIVAALGSFTGGSGETGEVDLLDCVAAALAVIRPMARERGIDVVEALQPVAPVRGVAGELGQVLLNLLQNAMDAIPAGRPGTITLESGMDGDTVWLAVADTGTGITVEPLARIFEPFFTTKGKDKAPGLGLAISRDLVRRAGGDIQVASRPGEGSVFTVRLARYRVAGGET